MGQRIMALALQNGAVTLVGGLEASGHPAIGRDVGQLLGMPSVGVAVTDRVEAALAGCDVLIEFTRPEPTLEHVRAARQLKKPIVIGTTGCTEAQRGEIARAAEEIPVLFSPNMSLGVNVLFELVQTAAKRLGPAYDLDVIEAHHRTKQDAPSGTAKRLIELAAQARGQQPKDIPVHAIRAGDIIGDHTVVLAGPFERLELTHRAHHRDAFAVGALRAAQFLHARPAGLYDMTDVLRAAA